MQIALFILNFLKNFFEIYQIFAACSPNRYFKIKCAFFFRLIVSINSLNLS